LRAPASLRDSAHRPTPIANKASEFLESSYLNERLRRHFCDACLYSFSLPQKLAFSTKTLVLIDTLTGVIAQRQLASRIRLDCRPSNDLCL